MKKDDNLIQPNNDITNDTISTSAEEVADMPLDSSAGSREGHPGRHRGLLLLVVGPSAVGKTTVAEALLRRLQESDIRSELSISYTTRPPREHETHGSHYHFVSLETFKKMEAEGKFLETAEVYGNKYGTPIDIFEKAVKGNEVVIRVIDVQGAALIRDHVRKEGLEDYFVDIFILPPSHDVLRQRIFGRPGKGSDNPETRLAAAEAEIAQKGDFKHAIVNEVLDICVSDVQDIVMQEISL